MEKRDEDLILEFLSGKEEALEMLFKRYKGPILNFSLRILANRADAEDVTGDVFLAVFAKKYRPQPNVKFSTWLYTVARNACITKIRKRKRNLSLWFAKENKNEYTQWDVADKEPLAREELIKQELATQVRNAIEKLPHSQKEAIILREYHKMSYAEISCILNCSLENVKILIYRARERLRNDLPSLITEDNDG